MTVPTFTILLPVTRPPLLMPFAIELVRNQTCGDFELFIVCDGPPAETVGVANDFAASDNRIRVFPFPKGERHGEAHRHTALAQARGRFVCQIADDDLWFPNHLEEMAKLLADVEFGNLPYTVVSAEGVPTILFGDLADPTIQARISSKTETFSLFGLTQAGYRLETYRRLPVGWSPAPQGIWTDLNMWRKFLALAEIRAGTRFVVTSVCCPESLRRTWSLEQRREENAKFAMIISSPLTRDVFAQRAFQSLARSSASRDAEVLQLTDALTSVEASRNRAKKKLTRRRSRSLWHRIWTYGVRRKKLPTESE